MSTYDNYFASGLYDSRYPGPNLTTLRRLSAELHRRGDVVIDFGAGTGRYALPLLTQNPNIATLIAVEPSQVGRTLLSQRALADACTSRIQIHSSLQSVTERADLCLALFGVLAHTPDRQTRLQLLSVIRDHLSSSGGLVISVPSIYRRFPSHVFRSYLSDPTRFTGAITYKRPISGGPDVILEYQLYSASSLRRELADAGFIVDTVVPESILPESMVTRSRFLADIDRTLASSIPASLGYGILAIATRR